MTSLARLRAVLLALASLAPVTVAVAQMPTSGAGAAPTQGPPTPKAAPAAAGPAAPEDVGPPPPGIPEPLHRVATATAWTHPSVRAAEGQIRAAGYDVRGARWLRFPNLTVEALAITRGSPNSAQGGTVLNAVIEQPIWTGGRIGAAIDRASAQLMVQRHGLDEAVRDLLLRAAQAYYEVGQQARRGEVLAGALRQHKELVNTISNRVNQQISPRSDLDLAKARASQVEQQLALSTAQRQAAYSALIELTGDAAPALGNVPLYDVNIHHPRMNGAITRALACDPRSARLNAQSLVARSEQRAAKAALFPQLAGQLSSNEILGERVGIVLRAQTGNGLSQATAAQSARERAQASEDAIATVQRELREALRVDFANNIAAQQRISSSSSAVESSSFVIDSYKRQFIAGRRTWLDVMNALQEATATRLAVVESEITAQLTTARIMLRTCVWEPRARFDVTLKDPDNG
jgi:adhesin transport system outer membrane protein